MKPFCCEQMGFQALCERSQSKGAGSHLISKRGDAELQAFTGITLGLTVERLMLPILLTQDHCEKVRSHKASRSGVERSWGLVDGLAITAAELLSYCLDHLISAGNALDRLGNILA